MKPSGIIACGGLAALSVMAIIEILVLKYDQTVEEQKEEILCPPVSAVIRSSVPDLVTTGSVGYTEKDIAMTDEELRQFFPNYDDIKSYSCWTCEIQKVRVPIRTEDGTIVGTNWVYCMDMFDQLDAYRRVRR